MLAVVGLLWAVFRVTSWEGDPMETDEMAPEWFDQEAIPYGAPRMCP